MCKYVAYNRFYKLCFFTFINALPSAVSVAYMTLWFYVCFETDAVITAIFSLPICADFNVNVYRPAPGVIGLLTTPYGREVAAYYVAPRLLSEFASGLRDHEFTIATMTMIMNWQWCWCCWWWWWWRRRRRLCNKHSNFVNFLSAGTSGATGATYIRWGRRECEDNGATLLYRGTSLYCATQSYKKSLIFLLADYNTEYVES